MADITLKYLTELPAATSISDDDLFHINQNGNDRSITASILRSFIFDSSHPVHEVKFFASNINPNTEFPGTTWLRIPGYGNTVRLSNESMSDVMQTGGSDECKINVSNMPRHQHEYSGNTEPFDYGKKPTTQDGAHTHSFPYNSDEGDNRGGLSAGQPNNGLWTSDRSSYEGSHSHGVDIGPHTHSFSGRTAYEGQGESFSVKNKYINLVAWYRVS